MAGGTCGKCGSRMEQGFIPEARGHSNRVSEWYAGAPVRRWWMLKLHGVQHREVETWRCTRCGYLENYAPK